MNKAQTKALFKECLHNASMRDENRDLILSVFNKYRQDYGYPPATDFSVQKSKKWGNMQFITEHGSLSYLKAIDHAFGKSETPKQKFKKACRYYLHNYMMDFKRSKLPYTCPHTNIELTFENSHVDHVGEFEFDAIAEQYIKTIDLSKIEYINTDDGVSFANEQDAIDFKKYHDSLCSLELVHSSWNLSR